MFGKIQTHVNIKSIRNELVQVIRNTKAADMRITYGLSDTVLSKGAAISMIKSGFFDGWSFRIRYISSRHLTAELLPSIHLHARALHHAARYGASGFPVLQNDVDQWVTIS